MFFVKLLRYIKSYVRFSLTGGFLERFINLCNRGGLPLWDIEPDDSGVGMTANTTVDGYKGMRSYARRTGVRLRVKERHGLRFVLHRYRHRRGLAAGLICFALFFAFMTNFLWVVEVRGAAELSEREVKAALEELGVYPGAYKRGIDARLVEQKLMLTLGDISWVAVNIKGSTAEVEIKERTPPPEQIVDEHTPTHVIASDTGQIKKLEVYEGVALLREGDTVMEGDVIVSGAVQLKNGSMLLKQARAMVLATVDKRLEVQVPLEQAMYFSTGRVVKKRFVKIFGFKIPLSLPGGTGEYYSRYTAEKQLSLLGTELPFVVGLHAYEVLGREVITLTTDEAAREAAEQLAALELQLFSDADITERQRTEIVADGAYLLRVDYKLQKNIAQLVEIK